MSTDITGATIEIARELDKITGDITRTFKAPKNDALRANHALRVLDEAGRTETVAGTRVRGVDGRLWLDLNSEFERSLDLDEGFVVSLGDTRYAAVLPFDVKSRTERFHG